MDIGVSASPDEGENSTMTNVCEMRISIFGQCLQCTGEKNVHAIKRCGSQPCGNKTLSPVTAGDRAKINMCV